MASERNRRWNFLRLPTAGNSASSGCSDTLGRSMTRRKAARVSPASANAAEERCNARSAPANVRSSFIGMTLAPFARKWGLTPLLVLEPHEFLAAGGSALEVHLCLAQAEVPGDQRDDGRIGLAVDGRG